MTVIVFSGCLFSALSVAAQDGEVAERVLRVGAHAMDITPTAFPVESAGSMTPRLATYANDPLHARCLVVDDGSTSIALAICDHCMIPRELIDRVRERVERQCGIPSENVLVAATHTHSGVTLTPTFQSKVENAYCEWFVERVAEGICLAHANRVPAKIGWTVGHNPNQVFNRRWYMRDGVEITDPFDVGKDRVRMNPPAGNSKLLKPAGPIDPEIPILSFLTTDNTPIALMANYSLHYVGGVPSGALSADYFGEFARQYMRLADIDASRGFVAMMTNGTSGNINNINFYDGSGKQEPLEQIRLVSQDVATSVIRAMKRIEYHDWVPLSIANEEITLRVRKPNDEDLTRARDLLADAGERPWSNVRHIYAQETLDLESYPNQVEVRIQAIRMGELGIVTSPCETFVETGLAIKRESPLRTTFTIELANGYNGYLPTREHHELGGYETWRAKSSYLANDAEEAIRGTQLRLLNSLCP